MEFKEIEVIDMEDLSINRKESEPTSSDKKKESFLSTQLN